MLTIIHLSCVGYHAFTRSDVHAFYDLDGAL
jgi:hypothetical protein